MRIITGTAKGRTIEIPKGIRPTQDKIRQAVFSMLYDLVKNARVLDLFAGSGAYGLEALSRGALSVVFVDSDKGCVEIIKENLKTMKFEDRATAITAKTQAFVERYSSERSLESKPSNQQISNVKCQIPNQCQNPNDKKVLALSHLSFIWHLGFDIWHSLQKIVNLPHLPQEEKGHQDNYFDLIFLDPPYSSGPQIHILKSLTKILTPEGVVVFEHAKETKIPEEINNLHLLRQRTYGAATISLLAKA